MRSSDILIGAVTLLLSVAITGLVKRYASKAQLFDIPNQRSSHKVATPRGGGLGFVVLFLTLSTVLFVFGRIPINIFLSMVVGGALVAGVGFVDDHKHVPARWRFLVHLISAAFAISILGGLPKIHFGDSLVDLGIFGDLVAVVLIVWLTNLYNFMDGIDGIAAVETVSIIGGILFLISFGTDDYFSTLLSVFGASVLGFLVWNWPPAKIFMGDVGSGFIGFVLGALAIISAMTGLLSIWPWLILSSVFLVDATHTLITRLVIGEEWYLAHNNHAYQKAARRLREHRPVTIVVLAINVFWLFPLAWVASIRPGFGWWLTLIAMAPLVLTALLFRAGRPDRAG